MIRVIFTLWKMFRGIFAFTPVLADTEVASRAFLKVPLRPVLGATRAVILCLIAAFGLA